MAVAGDLYGEGAVVIKVTAGDTITKGQVVYLSIDDGKWDPVTDGAASKFGVALDDGVDTGSIRVCIWGEVGVTATAAAIAKGELVIGATTGLVVKAGAIGETTVVHTVVGVAMEAFGSGATQRIFIGMVD